MSIMKSIWVSESARKSEKIMLGERLLQKDLDRYQKGLLTNISKANLHKAAENFETGIKKTIKWYLEKYSE